MEYRERGKYRGIDAKWLLMQTFESDSEKVHKKGTEPCTLFARAQTALGLPACYIHLMKKTDLAYAAGIIDGEGCIGIRRHVMRYANRSDKTAYVGFISVEMRDTIVTKWLFNSLGGNWYRRSTRPMGVWCTANKSTEKVLRLVYPYLKLKKKQGGELLRFFEAKNKYKHINSRQYPPTVLRFYHRQYEKLKRLKAENKIPGERGLGERGRFDNTRNLTGRRPKTARRS